jgi:methylenetetrahydrofolate dehydrogenase (NADP+)/methenyltetrahydrofolate cyclohydrolase
MGQPRFVTADMVRAGAVVVDVGICRTEQGLVGDVDFESVREVASWISPVPGGVGPLTVTMLLKNTFEAARTAVL